MDKKWNKAEEASGRERVILERELFGETALKITTAGNGESRYIRLRQVKEKRIRLNFAKWNVKCTYTERTIKEVIIG